MFDTTAATPRTPAQSAASRTNGSKSTGPTTAPGMAIASINGTAHGLAAQAVLLPSERLYEYEACVTGGFVTLMPRSPGEGQLAPGNAVRDPVAARELLKTIVGELKLTPRLPAAEVAATGTDGTPAGAGAQREPAPCYKVTGSAFLPNPARGSSDPARLLRRVDEPRLVLALMRKRGNLDKPAGRRPGQDRTPQAASSSRTHQQGDRNPRWHSGRPVKPSVWWRRKRPRRPQRAHTTA